MHYGNLPGVLYCTFPQEFVLRILQKFLLEILQKFILEALLEFTLEISQYLLKIQQKFLVGIFLKYFLGIIQELLLKFLPRFFIGILLEFCFLKNLGKSPAWVLSGNLTFFSGNPPEVSCENLPKVSSRNPPQAVSGVPYGNLSEAFSDNPRRVRFNISYMNNRLSRESYSFFPWYPPSVRSGSYWEKSLHRTPGLIPKINSRKNPKLHTKRSQHKKKSVIEIADFATIFS